MKEAQENWSKTAASRRGKQEGVADEAVGIGDDGCWWWCY